VVDEHASTHADVTSRGFLRLCSFTPQPWTPHGSARVAVRGAVALSGAHGAQGLASGVGSGGSPKGCSGLIVTSFDRTSLTNINPGSHLMWVHLAAIYLITYLVLRVGPLGSPLVAQLPGRTRTSGKATQPLPRFLW
jgi:hypothetical protein